MSTETIVDTGAAAAAAGTAAEADKGAAATAVAGKADATASAAQDAGKGGTAAAKGKTNETAATAAAGDDKGGAAAAALPDNWRQLMAGDNADLLKTLERFSSPAALATSYQEAAKKVREKQTVMGPPGKDATPEQVKAWREAMGVPETADKYEVKLSDNRQLGDADKPIFDAFAPIAHEVGLSNAQVSRIVDWQLRQQEEEVAKLLDRDEEQKAEGIRALREEWPNADYRRNMGAVKELMGRATGEIEVGDGKMSLADAILTARLPNGRMLGNEPQALRFLAQMGLDLVPLDSQLPPGHSEGSVMSRLEEIRNLRRTDYDKYAADHKLQAEERKLLEIEQRSKERNKAA